MLSLFCKNRNFRILLLFSTFTGIGGGMFGIFMMWAVHTLYRNPVYTGVAGFMFTAPMVASFVVGPLVDRWRKVTVFRVTALIKFFAVGSLLVSQLLGLPGVWLPFAVIFAHSAATLFFNPAYTAVYPLIVGDDDLVKANALVNIVGIATGLLIGCALYFLMAHGAGFSVVYGMNTAILLIALTFSIFLRADEPKTKTDNSDLATYFSEMKDGITFVKKGVMLPFLITTILMSFIGSAAYVNLPMFVEVHTNIATGYIILSALALVGGLVGSFISRMVEPYFKLWKILVAFHIVAGIARIVFVYFMAQIFVAALGVFVLYAGITATIGIFTRAIVQKVPPKSFISRVDTNMASIGAVAAAIGALAGGFLATMLPSVDYVFVIQGGAYIVVGVLLCVSKHFRGLSKVSEIRKK